MLAVMSEQNGTTPQPAAEQEESGMGERLLGIFGLAFGAAILFVGADLLTGGALSRIFGLGAVSDEPERDG